MDKFGTPVFGLLLLLVRLDGLLAALPEEPKLLAFVELLALGLVPFAFEMAGSLLSSFPGGVFRGVLRSDPLPSPLSRLLRLMITIYFALLPCDAGLL